MENELMTNLEAQELLTDIRLNGTIEVIEEGKELSDLIKVAKKRGIDLKDNVDLAGLKLIYAPVDKANLNKCRLPKKIFFDRLHTLVGKALDIDHERGKVIGTFIDTKKEGNKGIAYATVFKSNFPEEYEEMKGLFKDKTLSHSFEIHCSPNKRKFHDDGTFSLMDMTMAGGAILFRENPAFPESKVLEMAKKSLSKCPGSACDLIYSSKELITSNTEIGGFNCSCIKCGNKMTLKAGEHCKDFKCSKCGGQMRRAERPGSGKGSIEIIEEAGLPKEVVTCIKSKIAELKKNKEKVDLKK